MSENVKAALIIGTAIMVYGFMQRYDTAARPGGVGIYRTDRLTGEVISCGYGNCIDLSVLPDIEDDPAAAPNAASGR